MRDTFMFQKKGNRYILHYNDKQTDIRIYPVQEGDETIKLTPDGRIVPAIIWYGEGGPAGSPEKRPYPSEKAALEGELALVKKWHFDLMNIKNVVSEIRLPAYKPIDADRFAYIMEIESVQVDTGFTIEKSGDEWKIIYDGDQWGAAKTWDEIYSIMSHIKLYLDDILAKGPTALKEFIAPYAWETRGAAKVLLDQGKATGAVIQPFGSNFLCSYNNLCLDEIFPTLEAAQTELKVRYTLDKFDNLMDQIIIEEDE
jgi:hypothetical protein